MNWRQALAPAGALVLAVVWWVATDGSGTATASEAPGAAQAVAASAAGASASRTGLSFARLASPPRNASGANAAARELLAARLERAKLTLATYRASTRYPFDSRPAREHPDQLYPNRPIEDDKPLRMPHAAVTDGLHVKITQERVFVSGDDSARFTLTVVDDGGRVLPLRVLRANAFEPSDNLVGGKPAAPTVSLPFVDDGSQGDNQAADGIFTATLRPASQGFASFPGMIRTEVLLQVGEQQGLVSFDVVYAPGNAATWTGRTREALESGSLNLYLGANVQQAGRYVITGRVDDAQGRPVALVSFNDELAPGQREIRLTVFGRLVRDLAPAFPLTLRDVTGYLLKPDAFPDRVLMPRLDGPVLTTAAYPLARFSNAEWTSEERDRYLTEYGHDVALAQEQLDRLGSGP